MSGRLSTFLCASRDECDEEFNAKFILTPTSFSTTKPHQCYRIYKSICRDYFRRPSSLIQRHSIQLRRRSEVRAIIRTSGPLTSSSVTAPTEELPRRKAALNMRSISFTSGGGRLRGTGVLCQASLPRPTDTRGAPLFFSLQFRRLMRGGTKAGHDFLVCLSMRRREGMFLFT
ncbi:hypothetical protein E2C01_055665 [Portunus trituberculatus]|uniref:Uncharacterized protein n=1 Tax=Portunus trituberculatus TaxID=210409 RepID=A0A5B7GNC4_PORTR|nr:hypothetical protein [Portunus trituberculatus]